MGKLGPIGSVSLSESVCALFPPHSLAPARQVCGLHVWGVVNNAGRTGHNLSLPWPFYGLWVNNVVAFITGEPIGDAIMATVGERHPPFPRSPLTSHPRSPSGPTDAPAHFLRSFPEPFSLLLSVPKSVSLFPPAFLAGLASLQLPGYLPVPVFGVGRFSRQAHHSRQEYDSWGSFSSSQMRPRRPGELAPRNALSKPPNLQPPAARGRARGAKRAKGNNPGSPSDPTYTTFWLSAAPPQPLSLPSPRGLRWTQHIRGGVASHSSLPAVLYFPLFTSRLTHLSPGPWNHTPLHF